MASLIINSSDEESLSTELLCDQKSLLYRPLKGLAEPFEKFLNDIFDKANKSNKMLHIAGDFNLNELDHDNC